MIEIVSSPTKRKSQVGIPKFRTLPNRLDPSRHDFMACPGVFLQFSVIVLRSPPPVDPIVPIDSPRHPSLLHHLSRPARMEIRMSKPYRKRQRSTSTPRNLMRNEPAV
jgi:hypothetical protein